MQGKNLFEYAIIRIVPMVEREEFLNAGVIVYCKSRGFLKSSYTVDEPRILSICPTANIEAIRFQLSGFELISRGGNDAGPIGRLDIASRFRWLTATRSTIIQVSKVHPGLCDDPEEMLSELYRKLVTPATDAGNRRSAPEMLQ
jgi:hypothetical protein